MLGGWFRSRHGVWLALAVTLAIGAPAVGVALGPRESRITVSAPVATAVAHEPVAQYAAVFGQEGPFALFGRVSSQAATLSADGMVPVIVRVGAGSTGLTIVRVAGASRYETAIEASRRQFSSAPVVVLATGENWPDALGGSALAGACRGPLLLTNRNTLPSAVQAEIVRLGARKIYILGGTAAVGPGVEATLVARFGRQSVVRLGGPDRYATARLVADETIRVLGGGYAGGALVATGVDFPDATAGAALASALGRPILLARPGRTDVYVPAATRHALVLGGPNAVSGAVERALGARLGTGSVSRAGGANRYATAVAIARVGVAAGMTWDGAGVATGTMFPDALAGGAMLGARNSVLLLTSPTVLSPEVGAALAQQKGHIHTLYIFGGVKAVTVAVENAVRASAAAP